MAEMLFIEVSEEDAAAALMEAVNHYRAEGAELHGGLVPVVSETVGRVSKIGQWMKYSADPPEYKLVRAKDGYGLRSAVADLILVGWEMFEDTVHFRGVYLQWMQRQPGMEKRLAAAAGVMASRFPIGDVPLPIA
jgi:hypothetical protein